MSDSDQIDAILTFWFDDIEQSLWWKKDTDFDTVIANRFSELHQQAVNNELFNWRQSPRGSLAEVIVLDQFSRNLYRDKPQSFAADSQALALAQQAIDKQFDRELPEQQRLFLYMPFMHSESAVIHQQAVTLFTELGIEQNLHFELKHKAVIDQYGRYPHRNEILKRQSTKAELDYLSQAGAGF